MDLVDGLVEASALAELERRRFEQVGGLVRAVNDDRLAVELAEVSRHHAWRSVQWTDLLSAPLPPVVGERIETVTESSAEARADDIVLPAGPTAAEVRTWLVAELDDLVDRIETLVPRLHSIGDGPMVRTAQRVLEDLRSDQRLLSEPSH